MGMFTTLLVEMLFPCNLQRLCSDALPQPWFSAEHTHTGHRTTQNGTVEFLLGMLLRNTAGCHRSMSKLSK